MRKITRGILTLLSDVHELWKKHQSVKSSGLKKSKSFYFVFEFG